MSTERTVPSERNNTLTPSEVSRKSLIDIFSTAFNADQQRVLLSLDDGQQQIAGSVTELAASILDIKIEYIKVMQNVRGGYLAVGTSNSFGTFHSGGPLLDSKSLGDLIGDKKIIGFAFKEVSEDPGSSDKYYTVFGRLFATDSGEDMLYTSEDVLLENSATVRACIIKDPGAADPAVFDIYAICL